MPATIIITIKPQKENTADVGMLGGLLILRFVRAGWGTRSASIGERGMVGLSPERCGVRGVDVFILCKGV